LPIEQNETVGVAAIGHLKFNTMEKTHENLALGFISTC
jgi:hypothetical protein